MPLYSIAVLDSVPIAYWRFRETREEVSASKTGSDETDAGRNLTFSDTAVSWPVPWKRPAAVQGIAQATSRVWAYYYRKTEDDYSIAMMKDTPVAWATAWSPELDRVVAIPKFLVQADNFSFEKTRNNTDNKQRLLYYKSASSGWVLSHTAPLLTLADIVWAPQLGIFCGISASSGSGSTTVYTSTNGIDWTESATIPRNARSIGWSPTLGMFCVTLEQPRLTSEAVATSTNGSTWTLRSTSYTHTSALKPSVWTDVQWVQAVASRFIVVGTMGTIRSTDGINWSYAEAPVSANDPNSKVLAYSPALNGMVLRSSDDTILRSTNGLAWGQTTASSTGNVIWSPHLNKYVCEGPNTLFSADGVTWASAGYSAPVHFATTTETSGLTKMRSVSIDGVSLLTSSQTLNLYPPVATVSSFPVASDRISVEFIAAPQRHAIDTKGTIVSYGSDFSISCTAGDSTTSYTGSSPRDSGVYYGTSPEWLKPSIPSQNRLLVTVKGVTVDTNVTFKKEIDYAPPGYSYSRYSFNDYFGLTEIDSGIRREYRMKGDWGRYPKSICWSPALNLFVMGGTTVAVSSDGKTWVSVEGSPSLYTIAWSPTLGIFCGVDGVNSWTSSDGFTWTLRGAHGLYRTKRDVHGASYSGSDFNNRCKEQIDTVQLDFPPQVIWGNNRFCVVGRSSLDWESCRPQSATSTNGVTWTSSSTLLYALGSFFTQVTYSQKRNLFYAVAASTRPFFADERESIDPYSPGFVAPSPTNIYYSSDGLTWEYATGDTVFTRGAVPLSEWYDVASVEQTGTIVAVGQLSNGYTAPLDGEYRYVHQFYSSGYAVSSVGSAFSAAKHGSYPSYFPRRITWVPELNRFIGLSAGTLAGTREQRLYYGTTSVYSSDPYTPNSPYIKCEIGPVQDRVNRGGTYSVDGKVWQLGDGARPNGESVAWSPQLGLAVAETQSYDAEYSRVAWTTDGINWASSPGVKRFYAEGEASTAYSHRLFSHNHIVVTWESSTGTLRVFRDGTPVFQATGVAQGQTLTSDQQLVIGAERLTAATQQYEYCGTLDEVAIYDRVLTPLEVATHHTALRSNTADAVVVEEPDIDSPPPPLRIDIVNTSPLVQSPYVKVEDQSPNNRDGWYTKGDLKQTSTGLAYGKANKSLYMPSFTLSTAFTVEEWFTPKLSSRLTALLSGPVFLRLVGNDRWQFGFSSSTYEGRLEVEAGRLIHVAASHTFGAGQNTFLAVNGRLVLGSWLSSSYTATFSSATKQMTVSTDIATLSRVQFTTSGTLPPELSANTNYWTIRDSSTTSKLATSRANAVAGTFINLSSAGSGTHTVKVFQGEQLPPFSGRFAVNLSKDDILRQVRLSSTAKTITQIRAYLSGTSA